jgi:hypothetical protein
VKQVTPKAVRQYLAHYAEPECQYLPSLPSLSSASYQHCIIMPAFQEHPQAIRSALANLTHHFLLILVINSAREDATTSALLSAFKPLASTDSGNLSHVTAEQYDLLIVDRCSEGRFIPPRQGVGLARKIGADLALGLLANGQLNCPMFQLTDADVVLPQDYFEISPDPDAAALTYAFSHQPDEGYELACRLYELSMLYYVAGLKYAGSHYAYTTVGSSIAINPVNYAMVRGFPKRNAGEDFYLLNKLAKTGTIQSLLHPVIKISGRPSTRVPFGTGPAVTNINTLADPENDYLFYDPVIFQLLADFLATTRRFHHAHTDIELPPELHDWADQAGFEDFLHKIRANSNNQDVFDKALTDWFDGFRTLKFIHYFRDNGFDSLALHDLKASWIPKTDLHGLISYFRQRL